MDQAWPWLSLVALGGFHGLNPAMGWLFAVALGLQERRLRGVLAALGPIAAGHALAIGGVAAAIGLLGLVVPAAALLVGGGLALLAFAGWTVVRRFRHPRWVGMRVGARDLIAWSFLMATAHGAGLMLAPVLVHLGSGGLPAGEATAGHAGHAGAVDGVLAPTLAAVGLHTAAMFAVMAVVALVVYQKIGVEVLRRAWINLDLIWVGALAVAGGITLGLGLWPLLAA